MTVAQPEMTYTIDVQTGEVIQAQSDTISIKSNGSLDYWRVYRDEEVGKGLVIDIEV